MSCLNLIKWQTKCLASPHLIWKTLYTVRTFSQIIQDNLSSKFQHSSVFKTVKNGHKIVKINLPIEVSP